MPDTTVNGLFSLSSATANWSVIQLKAILHVLQVEDGVITRTPWRNGSSSGPHSIRWEALGTDNTDLAVSQGGHWLATLGDSVVRLKCLRSHASHLEVRVQNLPFDVNASGTHATDRRGIAVSELSEKSPHTAACQVLIWDREGSAWRWMMQDDYVNSWQRIAANVESAAGMDGGFLCVDPSGALFELKGTVPKIADPTIATQTPRGRVCGVDVAKSPQGVTVALSHRTKDGCTISVARPGTSVEDSSYAGPPEGWNRIGLIRGTSELVAQKSDHVGGPAYDSADWVNEADTKQKSVSSTHFVPLTRAKGESTNSVFLDQSAFDYHVFVSYSRPDEESATQADQREALQYARELYWFLKNRGLRVFWDRAHTEDADVPPLGSDYVEALNEALRRSVGLVAIIDERTIRHGSPPGLYSQSRELIQFREFIEFDFWKQYRQEWYFSLINRDRVLRNVFFKSAPKSVHGAEDTSWEKFKKEVYDSQEKTANWMQRDSSAGADA